ncbi:winged helix-turn-helix domain-containing protein [Actinomadura nitritigenes]|uniref:winged helix-turn-helix domain-containing protein n=1 Tax=Actinomadura nitritigenes TaxID=134602 RepID=UPI003D8BED51
MKDEDSRTEPESDASAGTSPKDEHTSPSISDDIEFFHDLASDDSRPPSKQIADQIRSAIQSGRLPPYTKLPSQNELSSRYGVARETVKSALRQLSSEKLIVSRKGSGSFVSANDDVAPPSLRCQPAPKNFIAAIEGLEEFHRQTALIIQTMADSQLAFDCSTQLAEKLRELTAETKSLRSRAAVRVASESREGITSA